MLIEVGKKYINAVGEVVEIVKFDKLARYHPFFDTNDKTYTKHGEYDDDDTKHILDLICLVDENLLKQYEANAITQKEFIAKHIELYTGEKL